jgi:hypothetical protein
MGTSLIGDISVIEVCGNVCGLYFMLEELKNMSRKNYHNVGARLRSMISIRLLILGCLAGGSSVLMLSTI